MNDKSVKQSDADSDTRSPRILITRLSALGDVIQSVPVACALRDAMPDAWIAWAVQAGAAPLLEGHPAIDQLITVSRRWMFSLHETLSLRRQLRSCRFDIAIDVQGLSKSALIAWLSGARHRIGYGKPWGRELSRLLNNEIVDTQGFTHIIERNMRCTRPLLAPLGIDSPRIRFDMPIFDDAARDVLRLIDSLGVKRPYVCLNVGAGWPSKRWPVERFAELARHLHQKHNLLSVIIAAPGAERELGEATAELAGESARLLPVISLQQLTELARHAALFVGSDTGPIHIAAAVDTPCVGLYGPFPAERHGPWGEKNVTIQKMCLEGPVKQRRRATPESMEAIDTASVCRACDEQLERYLA